MVKGPFAHPYPHARPLSCLLLLSRASFSSWFVRGHASGQEANARGPWIIEIVEHGPKKSANINNPARDLTAYRAGSNLTLDHITSNAAYETTRSTVWDGSDMVRILCIGGGGGNRTRTGRSR